MALQSIEYGRRAATSYQPKDLELWEIVSDVPKLKGAWPYVVAVLCIVLPGSGTMLAACAGYSPAWSKLQIFIGAL